MPGHPAAAQAAATRRGLARAAALVLLALVLLTGKVTAAEDGGADLVYVEPSVVAPGDDGMFADLIVHLPKNTTATFDCLGDPANIISMIHSSAVDVLGRSWMEFQYYPEYETELLPCVGQPSCELYTNPDFWLWADDPAQCPECQNCPECQRSLRVTYRCALATPLASPPPMASTARPAQTSSSQAAGSSGTSTPVGAIVGGVVGGVAAVAAVLAVWLYYRQRQHAAQSGASAAAAAGDGNGSGSSSEIDAKGHKPRDGQLLTSSRPSQLTMNALKALQAQQRSQAHSGPSVPAVRTALWHSGQVDSVAVGPPSRLLSGQSAYPVGAGASASLATQLAQQTSSGSSASWGSGSGIVDIKPWLLPFSDLDLHSRVGDGSYGTVILAYWHQTEVAVKVLHGAGHDEPLSLSNPLLAGLQAEATTMASLRHPCCVQFLGVCASPPAIVSEFCSRGSLTDVLRQARATPGPAATLNWSRRLRMAAEAASGMAYLHSRSPPVVHRDLKSPNILIDGDWHAKIADYNLAKVMDGTERDSGTSMAATNPRWLSPEVLHGGSATFASDVYAMGIILWELMTMEMPWAGQTNPFQIFKSVTSGERPPVPPDPAALLGGTFPCLAKYVVLMQECWAQQPQQRPTFADITARLREMQDACWPRHTL